MQLLLLLLEFPEKAKAR